MSFAESLLRVAQGSADVVDVLLENTSGGRASYGSSLSLAGEPTEKTGLQQALRGGQVKGLAIAACSKNGSLLDALARKDTRLTVRRQIAANPHTLAKTKRFLLEKMLKKPDSELLGVLMRNMEVVDAVAVLTGGSVAIPVERLGLNITDRDNALLALSMPNIVYKEALAECALRRVAQGFVEGLDVTQALENTNLDSEATARALSVSTTPLTARQAYIVARHYPDKRSLFPELTREAAFVLADCDSGEKKAAAISAWPNDKEVVQAALREPRFEAFEAVAAQTESRIVSRYTIDRLVEARYASDDRIVSESTTLPYYRKVSAFADDVPLVLLRRNMVAAKQMVELSRVSGTSVTVPWLRGQWDAKPRKGQIVELLADPQWAFTTHRGDTKGTRLDRAFLMDDRRHIGAVEDAAKKPWGAELMEHTPGIISVISQRVVDSAVLNYVYQRLFGAFGEEKIAWQQTVSLAVDFPGTIAEFIRLIAASCDRPLVGRADITLDAMWQ